MYSTRFNCFFLTWFFLACPSLSITSIDVDKSRLQLQWGEIMRIKQSILIIFGIALLLLTAGTAAAATYTVDDSGGADYSTINGAMGVAANGDTILVYPGTYSEYVYVNKELRIISESGPDNTIIQHSSGNSVFYVTANNVEITNFTIKATMSNYPGILLHQVQNNNISGNKLSGIGYGIKLYFASDNTVMGNTVLDAGISGIYLQLSSDNVVTDNKVSNAFQGIVLDYSDNNQLISNTVLNNDVGYHGIYLTHSNSNTLTNNYVDNNVYYGLVAAASFDNLIYYNYFDDVSEFYNDGGSNIWNSTEMMTYTYNGNNYKNYIGNRYAGYTGPDSDDNGIGDTPYKYDNYPLMDWPVNFISEIEPSTAIRDLQESINLFELNPGITKSLNIRLDNVLRMLDKEDEDKAIKQLEDFITFVKSLEIAGKLSSPQAADLIDEAEKIIEAVES